MPITEANPFKGRQYPGQVIVTAVRWYLRYPLAYEHVSELLAKRDASAAKRFFQKVFSLATNSIPRVINVDKNPAYPAAIEF